MTTDTNNTNGTNGIDPRMNRRQMMKTVGAAGGLAAVGVGAGPKQMQLAQRSEAIAPAVAIVGLGIAAGVGIYTVDKVFSGGGSVDETAIAENEVHAVASGIASQRASLRDSIRSELVEPQVTKNAFAKSAFNEIEAAAAKEFVDGNGSEAQNAAEKALDRQYTIALWNALQGWNSAIIGSEEEPGLIAAAALSANEGTGQFSGQYAPATTNGTNSKNGISSLAELTGPDDSNWYNSGSMWQDIPEIDLKAVEAGKTDNGYVGWKFQIQQDIFPVKPSNIEELPIEDGNPVEVYSISFTDSFDSNRCPFPAGDWFWNAVDTSSSPRSAIPNYKITHPDRDTTNPMDGFITYDELQAIYSSRQQLLTDLTDYIDTLDQALAEGTIEPANIISPSAAMEEFGEADSQSGFAARLAFSGIPTPDDLSYKAKVQHPDIQSEDGLWGTLFIAFVDQQTADNTNVSAGTTIPAADYRQAYLGIYREDNGNWDEILLTSKADEGTDQALEILDVDGTTDVEPWAPVEEESTAGANGKVVVWDEETMGEAPDQIRYPADHDGWTVTVEGAATQSSHGVSEVEAPGEEETQWVLPSTNLAEGEAIEEIRISGPVKYRQPVDYVQNPGNVNEEKIENRLDGTQRLIEEIRELENSGVGVGVGPDIDIPTIPGLGVIESAVVVILAFAGLNAASG